MDNIFYSIRNGKNPKYSYYLKSYFLRLLPLKAICRKRLNKILAQTDTRSDKNYINDRVNYYNRLAEPVKLPEGPPERTQIAKERESLLLRFIRIPPVLPRKPAMELLFRRYQFHARYPFHC